VNDTTHSARKGMTRIASAALLATAALAGASGLLAQDAPKPADSLLTKLGASFKLYGNLRLDTIYDDARFNDNQLAVRVLSGTPGGVASQLNVQDDLTMHGRLTRFGIDFDGGHIADLWNAKITGNLELDFYGGDAGGAGGLSSDSRNSPRMRKAVLKMAWDREDKSGGFSFSAGQDWDIIAPLNPSVNADMVMWNAGNLGDRRPQIRGEWWTKSGDLSIRATAGLGLTGAVSNISNPAGTPSSGEASSVPQVQGRLAFGFDWATFANAEKKQSVVLGLWSHYAREKADAAIGGRTIWTGYSLGMDLTLPLYADTLTITGEAWAGKNLADVRGGIGSNINAGTGNEIRARGGWAQLNYKLDANFTFHFGWSIDDPIGRDVAANNAVGNEVGYLACVATFGKVQIGAELQEWITKYVAPSGDGEATRVRLYFGYSF